MALPSGDWELQWGNWPPPVLVYSRAPTSTMAKSPLGSHRFEAHTSHIFKSFGILLRGGSHDSELGL